MSWSLALTHHSQSRWRTTAAGNKSVQDPQTLQPAWRFGCKSGYCFAVGETSLKLRRRCDTFRHLPAHTASACRKYGYGAALIKEKGHCWWLKLCLSTEFYLNSSITEQLLLLYLTPPSPSHPSHTKTDSMMKINLVLVFSSHLAIKPKGGKPPRTKNWVKLKSLIRQIAGCDISWYVKNASGNLPVLDPVSWGAITLHVYV